MPQKLYEITVKTYILVKGEPEEAQAIEDTCSELGDLGNDLHHKNFKTTYGTVEVQDYQWEDDPDFSYGIGHGKLRDILNVIDMLGHKWDVRGKVYLDGYNILLVILDENQLKFFQYYGDSSGWVIETPRACTTLKALLK